MDRARRAADEWARERPDLDSRPMVLVGRLTEAAGRIQKDVLRPFFAERGLQFGDFDVLATLRRSGAPYALNPTALYEATMVTSGAMTGRIDRLAAAGWVERRPDPKDRRGVVVALTPSGLERIDAMMADHVANEKRALSGLTTEEQARLSGLLEKLLASLPDGPADQN